VQLEEFRSFWTKALGIPGPQWMIVVALRSLDQGQGASAQAIADMLQTNLSFVTTQSRLLDSKGLVRATSKDGAILLSLTDLARQHLAELGSL
jgi:MarR family transcriptional regulator, organic hydroperoxide resistance regulator